MPANIKKNVHTPAGRKPGTGNGQDGVCQITPVPLLSVLWMRRAATWKLGDQSEMTNSNVLGFQKYPLQYLVKAYRAYVKSENPDIARRAALREEMKESALHHFFAHNLP